MLILGVKPLHSPQSPATHYGLCIYLPPIILNQLVPIGTGGAELWVTRINTRIYARMFTSECVAISSVILEQYACFIQTATLIVSPNVSNFLFAFGFFCIKIGFGNCQLLGTLNNSFLYSPKKNRQQKMWEL